MERFRKTLFGAGARSDEGYVVFFNSRSSVEFRDRTGKVFVGAEGLDGRKSIALYPEDMRVGSPTGASLQDETRRAFVLARVQRAAAQLGWMLG